LSQIAKTIQKSQIANKIFFPQIGNRNEKSAANRNCDSALVESRARNYDPRRVMHACGSAFIFDFFSNSTRIQHAGTKYTDFATNKQNQ